MQYAKEEHLLNEGLASEFSGYGDMLTFGDNCDCILNDIADL